MKTTTKYFESNQNYDKIFERNWLSPADLSTHRKRMRSACITGDYALLTLVSLS